MDGGGVHQNSGVLNRLFAVLTDGGVYADPSDPDALITIGALGLTKTTNLFLRTAPELTEMSQFYDFALALTNVCINNINDELYEPNLLNDIISESSEYITAADCDFVNAAVSASGLMSTENFCPNLDCLFATNYCVWKKCPDSDSVATYEVQDKCMHVLYRSLNHHWDYSLMTTT